MPAAPLVSVVVPAFNVERWVGACLRSLLAQTCGDLEILVVDDGSTDRTAAIVETYAARDPRIRLLSQDNAGGAAARNRGLDEARGAFVALQDADDFSHPLRLERQVDKLRRNPSLAVMGTGARVVSARGRHLGLLVPSLDSAEVAERIRSRMAYVHSSIMVRREVVDHGIRYRAGMVNAHDLDFLMRVHESFMGSSLREPLYGYRMHGDQLTNRHAIGGAVRSAWSDAVRAGSVDPTLAPIAGCPGRHEALALGLLPEKLDAMVLARADYILLTLRAAGLPDYRELADELHRWFEDGGASPETMRRVRALGVVYGGRKRGTWADALWARREVARALERELRYLAHRAKTAPAAWRWRVPADILDPPDE